MCCVIDIYSNIKKYQVEFIDSLDTIKILQQDSNVITIIDKNISILYPELTNQLSIVVDCIENNKTLDGCSQILEIFVQNKINTKNILLVIGGGILQDIVGFCASIYSRGIEYILVPTTLLAQADSCIGGKTSINFYNKKNILGTFYPPQKILIYSKFTDSLTEIDFLSGIGEIFKFHILQNKVFNFDKHLLTKIIHDSLLYKAKIIQEDEFDKGQRKILNFGHTFGHAIEVSSAYKIPHGLSVIIGSLIALNISKAFNYKVPNYSHFYDTGIKILKQSKIQFIKEWFQSNVLLEIAKSDKKNINNITMILINEIPTIKEIHKEEYYILIESIKNTYESF